MAIRTIAVLIDTSPAYETRIAYAISLAARHDAHLVGILLLPSELTQHPASSYVRGQAAIADLLHHQEARNRTIGEQARAVFNKLAEQWNVRGEFRVDMPHGDDERRLGSLHADLVVAAPPKDHESEDGLPSDAVQLATGVPFLLVPDSWHRTEPPQHVLIGWNASRESRRAVGDALPLLAMASSATILLVDPPSSALQSEEPGVEVAMFLLRHGVRLTVAPVSSQGKAIADVIAEYASSNGHDLIVLGAYSHARIREIMFGGVTRSLLIHASIPLLISH
ncbi:universal stress protein [Ancylobacter sp. VNQ12]|uniref:universal stress protein n=1 Tax=Ancylobacter sp. VNQ12 TaxID=3400920 RepID=UPI003C012EF0